jgi:hypothetical protein
MAFDLADLTNETDTAEMVVENPKTGDPITGPDGKPWTVTFASSEHPAVRDHRHRAIKRAQKLQRNGVDEDPEVLEERSRELLVARILSWTPVNLEGKPFQCTPENKAKLVALVWFRDQANRYINNEANFITGSAKTS